MPVRTVGHGQDRCRVPAEDRHLPARVGIPEHDRVVVAGGGKAMAVGAVRNAVHLVRVAAEDVSSPGR